MNLIRSGEINKEKPGIIIDDYYYDTSSFGEDYDEQFFERGGLERLKKFTEIHRNSLPRISRDVRLGSPIAFPSKMICIGSNYENHATETHAAISEEPIFFFKSTTSLCSHFEEVIIPKNSSKIDWEGELALGIGKKASYVKDADPMNYIAGYCLHNDLNERAFQLERGGQWVKGKSFLRE